MLVLCIAAVTSFDQWYQYGCPDEPLLPFSMFSVYDQSPPLQVFTTDRLSTVQVELKHLPHSLLFHIHLRNWMELCQLTLVICSLRQV
jgi:hypothetical protein